MSQSHDGRSGLEAICEAPPPAYQPIVDLRSGIVAGFEAVGTNPRDPSMGVAGASASSDEPRLADELACLEAAIDGAELLPPGAWLSVDVSVALVSVDGPLRGVLAGGDRRIVLELSERDRVEGYTALRSAITALGPDVDIAVDHAGSGNSGFTHAVEPRPVFVKVDPGLIHRIDADATQQLLVAGLRKVAADVGSRLVAVGVETAAERATLLALGIDLGQGPLLGRPAEAAAWRAPRARGGDASALQRWLGRR